MEAYIVIDCPHCKNTVLIYRNEINCAIFRHGIIKETGGQMNPHSSKTICDELFKNNKIYGCGKPFKLLKENKNNYKVEICDYI